METLGLPDYSAIYVGNGENIELSIGKFTVKTSLGTKAITLSKEQLDILSKQLSNPANTQEIERKFLMSRKDLPDIKPSSGKEIVQSYIINNDGFQLRLRKTKDHDQELYTLTYKKGTGISRQEVELPLSKDQYEILLPLEQSQLSKTRYPKYLYDNLTSETDIYSGKHSGLSVVEVEFPDEKSAQEFVPPNHFGKEVTFDEKFSNANLPKSGLLQLFTIDELGKLFGIEVCDIESGITNIINQAKELGSTGPVPIFVAGGSASGKTSAVSERIKQELGSEAMIVSLDDYSRGSNFVAQQKEAGNDITYDEPAYVNLERAKQQIKALLSGKPIEKPVFSFQTGEPDSQEPVGPKQYIIIEGLFALSPEFCDFENGLKVFVNTSMHGRVLRRLLRDMHRPPRPMDNILNYFMKVVEPMHRRYVDSTINNSDIIINNEYDPSLESGKAPRTDTQKKFQINKDIAPDIFTKNGIEILSELEQEDTYFSRGLSIRNRAEQDTVRIRIQGGKYTFTYKSPRQEAGHKNQLEFEIDPETKKLFAYNYEPFKTIRKRRRIFLYQGCVFTLDQDIYINGKKYPYNILELRQKPAGEKYVGITIESLREKLGLDTIGEIEESYVDMSA